MAFLKLKAAGLTKTSTKFSKLFSPKEGGSISLKKPIISKGKSFKSFNLGKFTKKVKLPTPKKIAIIKKAIKRNVTY